MKKIIAIIPARSGSKGLPDKNILPLRGKPLLTYAIEAAKGCRHISKVVVSTDSENYRQMALKYGAEVPVLRPAEISGDFSSMTDAINHILSCYKKNGEEFDLIVLLQPTSPLRTSTHIAEAVEKYLSEQKNGDETLVSVVKAPTKSMWLLGRNEKFVNFCFDVDKKNPQRQKLTELFLPNGAVYIASVKYFSGSFYTDKTLFYEMPENVSVDIDTIEDFKIAENCLEEKTKDLI